jgi:hypothetical protein
MNYEGILARLEDFELRKIASMSEHELNETVEELAPQELENYLLLLTEYCGRWYYNGSIEYYIERQRDVNSRRLDAT